MSSGLPDQSVPEPDHDHDHTLPSQPAEPPDDMESEQEIRPSNKPIAPPSKPITPVRKPTYTTLNTFADAVAGYLKCNLRVDSIFDESLSVLSTNYNEKHAPTFTIGEANEDNQCVEWRYVVENNQPSLRCSFKGCPTCFTIKPDGCYVNGDKLNQCSMCAEDPCKFVMDGFDPVTKDGPIADIGDLRISNAKSDAEHEQITLTLVYRDNQTQDVLMKFDKDGVLIEQPVIINANLTVHGNIDTDTIKITTVRDQESDELVGTTIYSLDTDTTKFNELCKIDNKNVAVKYNIDASDKVIKAKDVVVSNFMDTKHARVTGQLEINGSIVQSVSYEIPDSTLTDDRLRFENLPVEFTDDVFAKTKINTPSVETAAVACSGNVVCTGNVQAAEVKSEKVVSDEAELGYYLGVGKAGFLSVDVGNAQGNIIDSYLEIDGCETQFKQNIIAHENIKAKTMTVDENLTSKQVVINTENENEAITLTNTAGKLMVNKPKSTDQICINEPLDTTAIPFISAPRMKTVEITQDATLAGYKLTTASNGDLMILNASGIEIGKYDKLNGKWILNMDHNVVPHYDSVGNTLPDQYAWKNGLTCQQENMKVWNAGSGVHAIQIDFGNWFVWDKNPGVAQSITIQLQPASGEVLNHVFTVKRSSLNPDIYSFDPILVNGLTIAEHGFYNSIKVSGSGRYITFQTYNPISDPAQYTVTLTSFQYNAFERNTITQTYVNDVLQNHRQVIDELTGSLQLGNMADDIRLDRLEKIVETYIGWTTQALNQYQAVIDALLAKHTDIVSFKSVQENRTLHYGKEIEADSPLRDILETKHMTSYNITMPVYQTTGFQ